MPVLSLVLLRVLSVPRNDLLVLLLFHGSHGMGLLELLEDIEFVELLLTFADAFQFFFFRPLFKLVSINLVLLLSSQSVDDLELHVLGQKAKDVLIDDPDFDSGRVRYD